MDWRNTLERLNRLILSTSNVGLQVPEEIRSSGWCGLRGASEEDLESAERRIGKRLPPSYREFLRVANGWYGFSSFIPRLRSSHEVDWYRAAYPEMFRLDISSWRGKFPHIPDEEYFYYPQKTGVYRPEYLQDCLVIGDGVDNELVLLNSSVVSSSGEWEAWFFASWIPGAERYDSFFNLFEDTLQMEEASALKQK